jgi:hypothetical protein
MSEILSYEQLLNHRAQACVLRYLASGRDDEPEINGVLAEVSERRTQKAYESFSLMFHALDSGTPRQGMYAVTLPGLQPQEWFLVPVAREGGHLVYEVCFNRLADVAASR